MYWYAFGIVATAMIGLFTGFLGLFNLWYTFQNNKRTTYINAVTAERVKWINALRENISTFTGLVFHYAQLGANDPTGEQWVDLFKQTDRLRMLIKLQLNPSGEPDRQIEDLLDAMYSQEAYRGDPVAMQNAANQLVRLGQQLLKQEWEKVKLESKHGDLRDG